MRPQTTLAPTRTRPSTPRLLATRRGLARLAAASLGGAAVAPLLSHEAASAATPQRAVLGLKWHRCALHRLHTCLRARTCWHRDHQPEPEPEPVSWLDVDLAAAVLPTNASLHLLSRFSYGFTESLHAEMAAAGTARVWFAQQLDPAAIDDSAADGLYGWWSSLDLDHTTSWHRDRDQVEGSFRQMYNYQRWCLMRRLRSRRQVLEAVTEFFENHLHVPVYDDGVFPHRVPYGKMLREHALGRFDDMLVAAITHPAMGLSLDNATSTKDAPNENLGRELLELHTVGVGNYTERDVKDSAYILTGYRVDAFTTFDAYYDPDSHWTGPVQVMGFSHPNEDADGREVAEAYLRYLARHPATARRLMGELAQRFVSDAPSAALIDHLSAVYLASDTDITAVLWALVNHVEFVGAAGKKVRTPTDDIVATYRALDVDVQAPTSDTSTANEMLLQTSKIGLAPFAWPQPDGAPEVATAWSSGSRMLSSFANHFLMAGGVWPKKQAVYHPVEWWFPLSGSETMRFDALVDHLCGKALGRTASPTMLASCCTVTGLEPDTQVSLSHQVARWQFQVLLSTVLDSPDHMTR